METATFYPELVEGLVAGFQEGLTYAFIGDTFLGKFHYFYYFHRKFYGHGDPPQFVKIGYISPEFFKRLKKILKCRAIEAHEKGVTNGKCIIL